MASQTTPSLNRPQSAYWLWLADNRERIAGMVGKNITDVAKKGGEMWKGLAQADRQAYENKAKAAKEEYEKFIATEAGQKALQEKKAGKKEEKEEKNRIAEARAQKNAEKEERKNERNQAAAVKAVEKDDALKKPSSAYWLWLNANRADVTAKAGDRSAPAVAKKAGELWKSFTDADRKPWEKQAQEQKEAYDKFIASAEGQAKLKAFKDAQQAAKDKFPTKPKEAVAAEEAAEETENAAKDDGKKRKAKEEKLAEEPAAKRGKGRPPKVKADALGALGA